jgi:hypothetical protein
MVTVHGRLPVHAPLHPVKTDPEAGAALSVTSVLFPKSAEHVVPHEMPAGLLVTVPVPDPANVTAKV